MAHKRILCMCYQAVNEKKYLGIERVKNTLLPNVLKRMKTPRGEKNATIKIRKRKLTAYSTLNGPERLSLFFFFVCLLNKLSLFIICQIEKVLIRKDIELVFASGNLTGKRIFSLNARGNIVSLICISQILPVFPHNDVDKSFEYRDYVSIFWRNMCRTSTICQQFYTVHTFSNSQTQVTLSVHISNTFTFSALQHNYLLLRVLGKRKYVECAKDIKLAIRYNSNGSLGVWTHILRLASQSTLPVYRPINDTPCAANNTWDKSSSHSRVMQ